MFSKVFIFALMVCAASAWKEYDEGFVFDPNTKYVVFFSGTNCPYSAVERPHFYRSEKDNTLENVVYVRCMCDKNSANFAFCKENNIHHYPRIGAFVNGKFAGTMPPRGKGRHAQITAYAATL